MTQSIYYMFKHFIKPIFLKSLDTYPRCYLKCPFWYSCQSGIKIQASSSYLKLFMNWYWICWNEQNSKIYWKSISAVFFAIWKEEFLSDVWWRITYMELVCFSYLTMSKSGRYQLSFTTFSGHCFMVRKENWTPSCTCGGFGNSG